MKFDYTSIRYFSDEEVVEVLPELRKEATFRRLANYMQEGISDEEFNEAFASVASILEFQESFILPVLQRVERDSMNGMTTSGLDELDLHTPTVFISNHRNIVLDASMMNLLFYRKDNDNFRSSGVAIGNNLLGEPWVKNLARINGSFIVERDTNAVAMLRSSQRLSHYIRHILNEDRRNVWIAQREGRTKDGNDMTQPGLLKMLKMAGPDNFADNFAGLNMVPVAISYELDPNAAMKVKELYTIQQEGSYTKGPMDDFNSMYMGCVGQKGRVHYHFGQAIDYKKLQELDGEIPVNEKIKNLAEHIDDFVHQNYYLYPTAYVAADLLNGDQQFASFYDAEDKAVLEHKWQECKAELGETNDEHYRIFMKMYANPVKNRYKGQDTYRFSY